MALNDSQKTSFVFKKAVSAAAETSTGRDFFEEPYTGRDIVLPSQVWQQAGDIPATPTITRNIANDLAEEGGVIRYYHEKTMTAVSGASNAYYLADLVDAIPFNFGDGSSYLYGIKTAGGATIAFGQSDWVVNNAAGTLYFYAGNPSGVSAATPPKISFFKYIGTKGVGGGALPVDIGPQGLQGAQGLLGRQGLQGASGVSFNQGLQGNQGAQGRVGLQGQQGESWFYFTFNTSNNGAQIIPSGQILFTYNGTQLNVGFNIITNLTDADGNFRAAAASLYQTGGLLTIMHSLGRDDFLITNVFQNAYGNLQRQVVYYGGYHQQNGLSTWVFTSGQRLGLIFATAIQGLQGAQGIQGLQGRQGTQGLDGLFAGQGTQGSLGTQGFSGSQGTIGLQGRIGTQGVPGNSIQGSFGLQGSQGIAGSGAQGIAGSVGATGLQGSVGAGSQGVQGIAGTFAGQGVQGASGAAGGTPFALVVALSAAL